MLFASGFALLALVAPAAATPTFEDAGGAFLPAVRYPVGANPFSIAEGDFNRDGKVDIVVGNWDSNNVSVLLGTGAGVFAAAVNYNVGTGAQTVAVADFNGDQKLDLAVANFASNNVSVLLGNGSGSFAASVQYPVGINPRTVAVADFNGDNKPDLAVANGSSGGISILLGNGTGGFGGANVYEVGINPISVAIGRFNADAHLDLAVANQGGNNISILLGTGTGSFGAANNLPVGAGPTSVATGDFNADGKLDLAGTNVDGGNVSLLYGTGTGAFNATSPVSAGISPIYVAAGDLDGDGKPELAVANQASGTVSVLLGSASGVFGGATHLDTKGQAPRSVAIGDLNNDGRADLAVVDAASNEVSILLAEVLPVLDVRPVGNTDATSSYALRKSTLWINRQVPGGPTFSHAAYADFNKDGRVDFVRTFSDNTNVRRAVQFMRNDGGGNFSDQTATMVSNSQPGVLVTRKILTGDYNNDGWPDVFVLGHGLDGVFPAPGEYPQLFLSNGNGTLRYVPDLEPFPAFNHGGASGDIDNNGTVDVLVPDAHTLDFPVPGPATPYFLLNDGQGHFTRNFNRLPREFVDNVNYAIELVDIDQDGFIDILTGGDEFAGIGTTIYWGSASGYYRASAKFVLPVVANYELVWDFAAEDIDGDGRRDLIVYRVPTDPAASAGRYFQILRQTADRVFVDETATRISMNILQATTDFIRVQDLDGDGDPDIFLDDRDFVAKGEYAWINNGVGVFVPYAGPTTSLSPAPAVSITDVRVAEGNSGSKLLAFTVGLSSISPTPVTYAIATANNTATAGSDYVARSLSGETIPAGQQSRVFAVTLNGDAAIEADETFFVTLDNVVGATVANATAIGTLANDDVPVLRMGDANIAEGNTGTRVLAFTATLDAPAATTVTFNASSQSNTAVVGSDFVGLPVTAFSIAPGQLSTTVNVTLNGDTAVEGNETFFVNLSGVSGAILQDGQGVGTIINDDTATPGLRILDASTTEGNSGSKLMTFTVSLTQASPGTVAFSASTQGNTASAGSDFTGLPVTAFSIPAGQLSKTLTVTLNGDTALENDESFFVWLSSVSGATLLDGQGVGTILNDDTASLPGLRLLDASTAEGNSGTRLLTFTVTLTQASANAVNFSASTQGQTATPGIDFVALPVTAFTIAAGQVSKTFTVTLNSDTTIENDETFFVWLSSVSGASLLDGQGIGTIANDDVAGLRINDAGVTEGNSGTKLISFAVTLTTASPTTVSFNASTQGNTAAPGSDFAGFGATPFSIPAGQTSRVVSVVVNGDTNVEGNETFFVWLSAPSGATLLDGQGVGTITNDD
jgi:hypothetical protein